MVAVSFVLINRRCAFHHTSARACVCFFVVFIFPHPFLFFRPPPPSSPVLYNKKYHTYDQIRTIISVFIRCQRVGA
uniref:Uncharacterized protein n=1 Tax=Human herpesvirus 2 TaxID=10310 RepID=A0A481TFL9_HHV2|nr:hypothetical protein [Human alphaherpesvirus 2]